MNTSGERLSLKIEGNNQKLPDIIRYILYVERSENSYAKANKEKKKKTASTSKGEH
jgi:hypothetical protein